ncbi:phospholipid transfer protein isoform X1 [Thamnophis elegans]|uniref:phospholipid transfer protein isoform X1 n=2 Tax=Thamnophis elegans TaxID=35005 RepID=UPI0013770CE8|nr:phospholipid transfer protein isoform X1 [Thamnophis elegans]
MPEKAAMPLHCLLLLLTWLGTASGAAHTPACKMRITDKGLALVKEEGLRFVEQELESISIPDLHGKQAQFHYNISNVKVTHLQLNFSELRFQPEQFLAFRINNGSIGVRFRRQLLYWFFYDIGSIKAWAEGVNIHTQLRLSRDQGGRLKIANMSCNASIARMHAGFSGTLRKVYEFVAILITSGMRYIISQQICPALNHAGLVLLNSLLDTVPVRNPVDEYVGSDYSLLNDPRVTPENIDLDFKGMFFPLRNENETLPNAAPEPLLRETERMVYMGLSEYFFDSALFSYYRAGVLNMEFAGDEVPKDLQVLLRASFFGSIVLLNPDVVDAPLTLKLQVTEAPRCTIRTSGTSVSVSALLNIFLAPLNQPPVLLSSLTMESRLSAKVVLHGKALRVQLDLRRFRIYSNQSALESLALLPLQAPLKTLLQMTIMPFINEKTMKGVRIPLPEGMDFTKETIRSHLGYLTIGADLHFSKGLREVIEKLRATPGPSLASRAA